MVSFGRLNELFDEAPQQTFPASDPVAFQR
jgi:hypothetical protein